MTTPQDVQVPDYFSAFITRVFGDEGRNWLTGIPHVVARFAAAWELEIQPPFEGLSYNYVVPVRCRDGSEAVLKVGVPDPEQRSEIFAMRAFAGRGIARLLASDTDERVTLVERLRPGTMLATLFPDQDERATGIAADVMRELIIPAPADQTEFVQLSGWFERGFDGLRREFEGATGPFPTPLVERAEALYRDLQASTDDFALIHGDFHHMNVLYSEAHDGWLAIDPKGVVADRAYECAPFILNPNYAIHAAPNLKALMARRIDQFADLLGIDRYRIHGWTLAFTVLSAWWSYPAQDWRDTIALGELLAEI